MIELIGETSFSEWLIPVPKLAYTIKCNDQPAVIRFLRFSNRSFI